MFISTAVTFYVVNVDAGECIRGPIKHSLDTSMRGIRTVAVLDIRIILRVRASNLGSCD